MIRRLNLTCVFLLALVCYALWFSAAFTFACDLTRYEFNEQKMGVPISLILYAPDDKSAEEIPKAFNSSNASSITIPFAIPPTSNRTFFSTRTPRSSRVQT